MTLTINLSRYSPTSYPNSFPSSQSDEASVFKLTERRLLRDRNPSTSSSSQPAIIESIFSDDLLFDLNTLPSHSQEIAEEHDIIEQQIDEELIQASETNDGEELNVLKLYFGQYLKRNF
ncbi:hypothetical protein QN277_007982 [Acacia crassicarpa]|uniref:Uncharacterized protein n=1 Tax=Acacia crassicarpa TaxID=499986 RepID=A0AAE1MCM7_9FABA|nr:hypothetical protein QN277_007982 [Acacia crassicarpa]